MLMICVNLSPKLHDYSTWTRSWFLALAATINQPFKIHFEHVHVPASSPCLPPLLGPKFLLVPRWESDFELSLHKEVPFVPCHLMTHSNNIHYVHDVIFWKSLTFILLVTWCGTFVWILPPLKKVMSSSHFMFFCFFAGLLWNYSMVFWALFHVELIHPRCFYWMVSFPLHHVFLLPPP
jgi:hypothetical protein